MIATAHAMNMKPRVGSNVQNVKANALASSDIPIHAREVQVYDSVQDMVKGEQAAITFSSTLEVLANAYVATFNREHEKWNGYLLFAKRALRCHQGGREIPEQHHHPLLKLDQEQPPPPWARGQFAPHLCGCASKAYGQP